MKQSSTGYELNSTGYLQKVFIYTSLTWQEKNIRNREGQDYMKWLSGNTGVEDLMKHQETRLFIQ